MKTKKIVFFDIDGTLLDHDKKIPASAKTAIHNLRKNGIDVAIATGRAPFTFDAIRRELQIETFVCLNGQYVVRDGKTIYKNAIDLKDLDRLYKRAKSRNCPMVFMGEDMMCASEANSDYIVKGFQNLHFEYPRVNPDFHLENDIYQALLFCENADEKLLSKEHNSLRFVRWHDVCCDVLPTGSSKAVGMRKIMEAGGYALDNTYAFGDGLNDMEMLASAGTGVAMGNAIPELKEAADTITANVDEDGVRRGLERLGLI